MVSRTFKIRPHNSGFEQIVTIDGIDEAINEAIDRAQDKIGAALVNNVEAIQKVEASFARPHDGHDEHLRAKAIEMCIQAGAPLDVDLSLPKAIVAFIKGEGWKPWPEPDTTDEMADAEKRTGWQIMADDDRAEAEAKSNDYEAIGKAPVTDEEAGRLVAGVPVGTEIPVWRFHQLVERCMKLCRPPKGEWKLMPSNLYWRRVS